MIFLAGLNPISITTVTTSGVSEGTVEEIFDTDNSGDPDLSTSIALSATDNPWVVIDLGSETIINSVDISVPEVQCKCISFELEVINTCLMDLRKT